MEEILQQLKELRDQLFQHRHTNIDQTLPVDIFDIKNFPSNPTNGYTVTFSSSLKKWVATAFSTPPAVTDVQTFNSNGTWTKPVGAKSVQVICIGSGGGGASGRRSPAATNASGGGGGGGGGVNIATFDASGLGSTETVTVGVGGTGGTAQTTNGTNGIAGGNGSLSSFGSWIISYGGGGGSAALVDTSLGGGSAGTGGSANGPVGGVPIAPTVLDDSSGIGGQGCPVNGYNTPTTGNGEWGGGIGACTAGTLSKGGSSIFSAPGGGAGGFLSGAGATVSASEGGSTKSYTPGGGGAGGTSGGSPTAGTAGTYIKGYAGQGGGGGGSSATAAGAAGGAGIRGSGGGGGGASRNGNNSGAGGNGGNGIVVVVSYF